MTAFPPGTYTFTHTVTGVSSSVSPLTFPVSFELKALTLTRTTDLIAPLIVYMLGTTLVFDMPNYSCSPDMLDSAVDSFEYQFSFLGSPT